MYVALKAIRKNIFIYVFMFTDGTCGKVMFSCCLCACLSVRAITFECLDLEAVYFGILVHLDHI